MAHIFPVKEDLSEIPFAELRVYEALESLGKNFYVFHSVQWLKRTKKWAATWKENDFLILNKSLGAIVLEVKGGDIEYTGTVFHQINTQTKEVTVLDPKKKKDPLSQAIDGAYHYRDVLEKIRKATATRLALDDRFPVEVAVWFSTCKIGDLRYKGLIIDHVSGVANSSNCIFLPDKTTFNWKGGNGEVRVNCKKDAKDIIEKRTSLGFFSNGEGDTTRNFSMLINNQKDLDAVIAALMSIEVDHD